MMTYVWAYLICIAAGVALAAILAGFMARD